MGRLRALEIAATGRINMFNRDPSLPIGMLPYDAQYRLKAAAQVGEKESLARQRAINNVYRWIEATYPQYLRLGRVRAINAPKGE